MAAPHAEHLWRLCQTTMTAPTGCSSHDYRVPRGCSFHPPISPTGRQIYRTQQNSPTGCSVAIPKPAPRRKASVELKMSFFHLGTLACRTAHCCSLAES